MAGNSTAGTSVWPDGADFALRDAIRTERIAERSTDVFLGSGDGGFAHLAEAGSTTPVVANPRQLSGRLRMVRTT